MSAHPPATSPTEPSAADPQNRPASRPRSRARKWVIAAIVALAVAVAATVIVVSVANSPRNQALRKADALIQGYLAGDPTALDLLVDAPPSTSFELLTPATARAAFGETPRYTITKREADDVEANVTAYIEVEDRKVPLKLKLNRSSNSDYWRVTRIEMPTALVSTQGPSGIVKANGTELRLTPEKKRRVALWPGTWTFTSEGMVDARQQFFDTRPPKADYDGKGPGVINLAPEPLTNEILGQAVKQELTECLGEGDPARVPCPFSPPYPPKDASGVRNVRFSDLQITTTPIVGDTAGTWLRPEEIHYSAEGSVLATGQFKVGSDWRDVSERTEFIFTFTVRRGANGLELRVPALEGGFSPFSQPSDYVWGQAQTVRPAS